MRKVLKSVVLVSVCLFAFVCMAHAVTLDDAKALGIEAAEYAKKVGKEAAMKEMNKPGNPFDKSKALYVTLSDINGHILAHPKSPGMSGQNHTKLKDKSGKFFVQEQVAIAKSDAGSGWMTFYWSNPATKKVQLKKVWVQRVAGTDLYTMCGLFQ